MFSSPPEQQGSAGNGGRTILPQAKKPCRNAVALAGNGGRTILPQAKKPCRNAVAREDSWCLPGWRSQREDQIMLSSAAAFRRSREQGSETQQ
jgi:hypothetical protein